MLNLLAALVSGLAKLAEILFAYRAGQKSARLDTAEKALDDAQKAKQIDSEVAHASDDQLNLQLDKWMRDGDRNK